MTVTLPTYFTDNFTCEPGEIAFSLTSGIGRSDVIGIKPSAGQAMIKRVYSLLKLVSKKIPYGRKLLSFETSTVFTEPVRHAELAVLIAVLVESKQLVAPVKKFLFLAALNLDGRLLKTGNMGLILSKVCRFDYEAVILPAELSYLQKYFGELPLYFFSRIGEVLEWINTGNYKSLNTCLLPTFKPLICTGDLGQIRGQEKAKRAIVLAAAGGHHILLAGSAGVGKTMLLDAYASLPICLPVKQELLAFCWNAYWNHEDSSVQHVAISSKKGIPTIKESNFLINRAYFRRLIISELAEAEPAFLKMLKKVFDRVFTGDMTVDDLVSLQPTFIGASTNLCPCGYWGTNQECVCRPYTRQLYQSRLTKPLLQRFSIQVVTQVENEPINENELFLYDNLAGKLSLAYKKQFARNQKFGKLFNQDLLFGDLKKLNLIKPSAWKLFDKASNKYKFALRTATNVLKVALTIADYSNLGEVDERCVLESLQYQALSNKLNLSGNLL